MSTAAATLTPAAPAPNRRRAMTRARICEAASQLFFEQGYALVTMEHIAQGADIRRSTLYLHFREKDEILAAIAKDYTAKLRLIVASLPSPTPSHDEVAQWVTLFAEFVSSERAATELLVTLSHLPKAPAAAWQFGQDLLGMMAQRLPAIAKALDPGAHMQRARAVAVMDTLGWALCNHARYGVNDLSQARLNVATDFLYRFVRGEL